MDPAAYEAFARDERDHFWFVGRRAIFFDLLKHRMPENGAGTVLDLGCGVGGMLEGLSAHGRVVAMDLDRGSVGYCRNRGHRRTVVGRGPRMPFRDGAFGLVAGFDVVEHIRQEREVLEECWRVLSPGGHLILSVPAYQFLYSHQDRMVEHHRRYTRGDLVRKVRAAGFDVVQASYINIFLFPIILPVVLLKKLREAIRPPKAGETRFNTDVALPGPVNRLFSWLFSSERRILRRMNIPVGHSIVLFARKPSGTDR